MHFRTFFTFESVVGNECSLSIQSKLLVNALCKPSSLCLQCVCLFCKCFYNLLNMSCSCKMCKVFYKEDVVLSQSSQIFSNSVLSKSLLQSFGHTSLSCKNFALLDHTELCCKLRVKVFSNQNKTVFLYKSK